MPKKNAEDIWYQPDGTVITELPQNLSNSILLTKKTISSDNNIASGSYGDITWVIDADGKLTVTGTGEFSDSTDFNRAPWYAHRKNIKSAQVNVANMTDASYMFFECENMVNLDLKDFNTSQVTSMNSMFRSCKSLTSVDVGSFDTENVTDMGSMFEECNNLTSIDANSFWIKNVISMYRMFADCSSLTSIDVFDVYTRNAIEMGYMFKNCSKLVYLNLSSFDFKYFEGEQTEKNVEGMLNGCVNLTTVYTPCNLTQSILLPKAEVGDIWYQPDETQITELPQNLDYSIIITKNGSMVVSGSYKGITWNINNKGNLVVKGTGDFAEPTTGEYYGNHSQVDADRAPWFAYKELIETAEVNVTGMTDSSYMFNECRNLKNIELGELDTESITNMIGMFCRCEGLEDVNVSKFNTGNVTNMGAMFYRCLELTSVDVSGFDTSKVTNMSSMFGECPSLETLDVSGFDTSKVTSMSSMFWSCCSLKTIDVSGFDTSKVTSMGYMFTGCAALTSLDMSGFDVSKVTNSSDIFLGTSWTGKECGATTIYTPCNLGEAIELPSGIWYQPDGTVITELPKNLPYSILITKNTIPTVSVLHITATKAKKVYTCGEVLNIDDLTVRFYDIDGTVKEVTGYDTNIAEIDMSTAGAKRLIITYNNLTTEIELKVTDAPQYKTFTVTFDLCGHGMAMAPITDIPIGSLIMEVKSPVAEGYRFMGWYKDPDYINKWNFNEDTVRENITLYAYWAEIEDDAKIGNLYIEKIPIQLYTGSAIKPTVVVYYQSDGSKILLKAGTDYTVNYYNNIEADTEQEKTLGGTSQTDTGGGFTKDLAYFVIACKGNYTGSVYQNFHIDPASITDDGENLAEGFRLNYTEQFVNSTKSLKPFRSLKYKKTMEAGTDFNIQLTVQKAYDDDGKVLLEGTAIDENSEIPKIPEGYQGTFLMSITGINNYEGTITRTIYVADKNHLMKNASVTLGKNQKTMKYTGDKVVLTPAWYDIDSKSYYVLSDDNKQTETDKKDVFTVKMGTEYLLYGKDFTVSYQRNRAVGTATMTIMGIGDYVGTKNVKFRITGTAFNARNIRVSNFNASLVYTGEALTQNEIVLTDISGMKSNELVRGTDYWIAYKNNLKKGTATMTFTAKPISGYSGSFKQTFKITAARLEEMTNITVSDTQNDTLKTENETLRLDGKIMYTKEGAKPSERIVLTNRNTNSVLKEGTDYTVSYVNNKTVTTDGSLATMTIKGKGNYIGIVTVNFPIIKASFSENENLTNATTAVAYNEKNAEDYQYLPKVKLMDKKKTLSASKDYEVVEYKNCSQVAVNTYLESVENGTATADARPYAIVKAREESGYEGNLEVDLTIYRTKLTAKNLYIVMPAETAQITYTGKQVKPEVAVYYGEAEAVEHVKNAGEINENVLTDKSGSYKLIKLNPGEDGMGDYTLAYGINIKAGINKGSITVNGAGLYGGKVTVKFTILGKDVYETNIEKREGAVANEL